ncbi:MAG: NAD(+) synthase [Firmicutes bacterium]|nr:NAD(+) synthase [Bacillota bacterium]
MDSGALAERLTRWIRYQVVAAGGKGVVFGLSGGLDSAVVAALAKRAFPKASLGVIMPCYSDAQDAAHARLVAQRLSLPVREIVLDQIYDVLLEALKQADQNEPELLAAANLKPRLRMITLYYFAAQRGYLVIGSTNKSELTVGYFTKHGDVGDILPLGNLVKRQVVDLARHLKLPDEIINKPPSAGLWPGQTDEAEMGLSYDDLDCFILSGQASSKAARRILDLKQRSKHKRIPSLRPDF